MHDVGKCKSKPEGKAQWVLHEHLKEGGAGSTSPARTPLPSTAPHGVRAPSGATGTRFHCPMLSVLHKLLICSQVTDLTATDSIPEAATAHPAVFGLITAVLVPEPSQAAPLLRHSLAHTHSQVQGWQRKSSLFRGLQASQDLLCVCLQTSC